MKKKMPMKKDEPKKPITKKPIQLAEVKVTASKKPMPKMASKPTVKADTVKRPTVIPKKPTVRPDSVSVGYGDRFTKMSAEDLKGMVKKYNLKSVDTSSVRKMKETSYGSRDMADTADRYLASKKKNK